MDSMLRELGINTDVSREMIIFTLILLRTMVVVFMTPFLGGKTAPGVLKMGIGGMFAILMWPLARGSITALPVGMIPIIVLMMKEVFVGLVIGYINQMVFFVMEVAGRLIDTFRGTAMAEVMEPHAQHRVTITGNMYEQLMLVFFMALGGHHIFFEAYANSFFLIPVDGGISTYVASGSLPDHLTKLTNEMLVMSLLLSLPAGAATFITDVVFGMLNRVAPQLNAYFMAMPVKAIGGLLMVMLVMDVFVSRSKEFIEWELTMLTHGIKLLAPIAGGH